MVGAKVKKNARNQTLGMRRGKKGGNMEGRERRNEVWIDWFSLLAFSWLVRDHLTDQKQSFIELIWAARCANNFCNVSESYLYMQGV